MRASVLPGGEPKEHKADVMGSGLVDYGLDGAEIVLSLNGFHCLPVDGCLEGIGMHGSHRLEELRVHGRPVVGIA